MGTKKVSKIKEGDIVYTKGWGGVIGQVVKYDPKNRSLLLKWPNTNVKLSKYSDQGEREFYPLIREEIKVLTVQDLFTTMPTLISDACERQRRNLIKIIQENSLSFEIF